MAERVPLSILDLSPVTAGSTTADAVANTIDLAVRAEAAGYHRYWLAEHHMTPGVASAAPPVLIALVAAATSRIRVGAGAVQMGHQTPLAVVEQFGTLDAAFPGRIDLGVGRSGQRRAEAIKALAKARDPNRPRREDRWVDGVLVPAPPYTPNQVTSPRARHAASRLQQPGAESPDFDEQLGEILALLAGTVAPGEGIALDAVPGAGADVEVIVFGSSPGQSAQAAGARGLPFAASYHITPWSALRAVEAYRAAFRPSAAHPEPHVIISADVVVAADDETAAWLASPYGMWVHAIRSGEGAIEFPSPEEAARFPWTDEDRARVADRVRTQFVGSAAAVVERLDALQRVAGADEVVVTTITHDHADRVRSHLLLAEEWATRA